LYTYGGFSGDGGFDLHVELHCLDFGTNNWEECDVQGTFPRTARPLSCVVYEPIPSTDIGGCYVYIYGGFDGKHPLCSLSCLSLGENKWKPVKIWLGMTESFSFTSSLSTDQNFLPIPRYGHSMIFNNAEGVITIFGGCGSLFLDDLFQVMLFDE
jgi:hypothetical protein